jgi:hypothetical protein
VVLGFPFLSAAASAAKNSSDQRDSMGGTIKDESSLSNFVQTIFNPGR